MKKIELEEILKLKNGDRVELKEMVNYPLFYIEEHDLVIFEVDKYKVYTTLKHDGTEFYLRYNVSFIAPRK